jgi:signal transduction histidine kinase
VGGLDRFRNYGVVTYAQHEGLGTIPGWGSVVAGRDGSIWMGTNDSLRMWNHGEVTIYGRAYDHKSPSRTIWLHARYATNRNLRDNISVSVFADNSGRILVSTPYAFGYMENGRFVAIRGVPGGVVSSVAQDRQGNLWIANQNQGLLRLSKDGTVQRISWASIGHKDGAQALAAGRSTGGLWLGFDGGGVAYFSDGQIKETYGHAEGLGGGRVSALHIETDDTVWAATEEGLSRIKNGRVLTLTSKNGLPCDAVHWITQDENDSFWVLMTCGLVRMVRTELHAWATDSQRKVKTTVFDNSDGVPNAPIAFHGGSQVTRSLEGKIWFQGFSGGASVIDPQHLPNNKITPPVHIEEISANDKTYDASNGLRLPPRIRDLKIDYTALSFVSPERVQFRYQLEGQDRNWREAANDREVHYSNLAPGNYVFRVIACNNSGLWNEAGDTLEFSIAPVYYQTNWFRALCVAAVLVLVWGLYRLRLHQLQRRFNAGLEAHVSERTRIARELHDTLLQNLHGLMFQFQAARNMLPREPHEAAGVLDSAIGATEQTITDSRDAIQNLRSEMGEGDLGQWLTATGQELARSHAADGHAPVFRLTVEGERKTLSALPRDEVCRIAREILRNAFQHAQANRIEAEIRYDDREFRLRIRDDGKGVDPRVLQAGGTAGHWGLRGVRERAQQIGARLDFWSEAGAGTEVELTVPAAIAYDKAMGRRRRFSLLGKA